MADSLSLRELEALKSLTEATRRTSLDEGVDLLSLRSLARSGMVRKSFRRAAGGSFGHEYAVYTITDLGWRALHSSLVAH